MKQKVAKLLVLAFPNFNKVFQVECDASGTAIKVCMVNGKIFEKEVKKNQVCFVIILRGPSVGSNDQVTTYSGSRVPEKIVELLNEYKDIITKDILDGLPPLRRIGHCMNLIPGSSFPNKAPYRLTPKENEELNREVHKFLQKRLIREILSPCAIPTIVAPKKNR